MKNIKFTLLIGLILAASAFGQLNTLVQTSLSAAITQTQTVFAVGSVTGINAPSAGIAGSAIWVQDIGQQMGELMTVQSISSTTLTVSRTSSRATAHLSGAMVLVATAPNWFQAKDPRGSCTTAATYVTPWLNTTTGAQWVCSAKTLNWIPGWNNYSAPFEINAGTAVASVAGTTGVDGPLIHVSGTNAITAWQPGIGWQGQGFCVIPDAAFTTTTGGTTVASTRVTAIAIASTAVANKTLCFTYDATNSKFTASY
jgi:hypothetical protein